eukprot:5827935-Amphidinium_carterae.2
MACTKLSRGLSFERTCFASPQCGTTLRSQASMAALSLKEKMAKVPQRGDKDHSTKLDPESGSQTDLSTM